MVSTDYFMQWWRCYLGLCSGFSAQISSCVSGRMDISLYFIFRTQGCSCSVHNSTCIEVCVKWCQSWFLFLPLWSLWKAWAGVKSSRHPSPASSPPTHPPSRLPLEILFIALAGFSRAGPIRSISAPFEERITTHSPLSRRLPTFCDINESFWSANMNMCANVFLSIYLSQICVFHIH